MSKAAEDLVRVEAKIASYLEKNPEFFERHPQLLEELKINHKVYGSVSLVERQILNLRQRTETLQGRLNEMVRNAQDNSELLMKCSDLAVKMIEVDTKQEVIDVMHEQLTDYFDIDDCQFWLCDNVSAIQNVGLMDLDTIRKLTDHQFIQDDPICGRVTESISQLFKTDESLESYAIIPLGEGAENGVIALGSTDVNVFTADMGTLFLRFIGDICHACLIK